MTGAKLLITGLANSGKTSLLKTLKNVLVISRDGKPFSLPLPHFNVPDYTSVNELMDMIESKINIYKTKYKEMPQTIVFDSVSRIFTDIESNCNKKYNGFDVWKNVNLEISDFVSNVNQMVEYGINVVLIAHVMWDEKAGKFIETCKGNFAKIGGFLSVVDYAVNIDTKGNDYVVQLYGNNLSRTLLENMPQKILANEFNLQDYINKIHIHAEEVNNEFSL